MAEDKGIHPIPADWDGTPEEWERDGAHLMEIAGFLDALADEGARLRLARAAEGKDGQPRVYFLQASSGEIKIGHASSVLRRMGELQTGHPDELVLIGVAIGGRDLEAALHQEFAAARLRGEWFRPSQRLLDRIEDLSA